MPIHDWSRVHAGIFHDFHHEWLSTIKHALNREFQGTDYYALAEQVTGGWGPDVLTLKGPAGEAREARKARKPSSREQGPGVAVAEKPPQVRFRITDEKKWYATKKKAVTIRHVSEHNLVAVLEILS